jgi:enterochelin esterase-like enzyme
MTTRSRVICSLAITLMLCAACTARAAVIEEISVPSGSMNTNVPAAVVLPEKYRLDPGRMFDVVYVLHGAGGNYRTYATDELKFLADRHDLLFVCADGDKTSWWFDSPVQTNSLYETHVVNELVPWIDAHYRVLAARTHRALMGGSMGGHGACWVGFRHTDVFGAVGSIYGGMDLWDFKDNWGIAGRLGPRDEFPQRWREHTVLHAAKDLKDGDVEFIQVVGTSDFFLSANRALHALLTSNKVSHTYIEIRANDDHSSGHSGEFNAMAKPILVSFFANYFKNGEACVARGFYPLKTRYSARIVKATPQETQAPVVSVPSPWRVVEGNDALTGLDVRNYYFTLEAPGRQRPAPSVTVTWPNVSIRRVLGAKDVAIDGTCATFVPVAKTPPTHFRTHWKEGSIGMGIFHNVPGVQHGPYADKPFPTNEAAAQLNWQFAARELFRATGTTTTAQTLRGDVNIYGFESNFPNGHVDAPPHFHIMLTWREWNDNNVGHFHLDKNGFIVDNDFMLTGKPLSYRPGGRSYERSLPGDPAVAFRGEGGEVSFEIAMLKGGSGLVVTFPGRPEAWKLQATDPVQSVSVYARSSTSDPWRETARVCAVDDTTAGILTVTTVRDGKASSETWRYDPDTGALR